MDLGTQVMSGTYNLVSTCIQFCASTVFLSGLHPGHPASRLRTDRWQTVQVNQALMITACECRILLQCRALSLEKGQKAMYDSPPLSRIRFCWEVTSEVTYTDILIFKIGENMHSPATAKILHMWLKSCFPWIIWMPKIPSSSI